MKNNNKKKLLCKISFFVTKTKNKKWDEKLIRKSAKSRATKTATGGAKYDTFDGPDFTFLLGNRLGEKKKTVLKKMMHLTKVSITDL